MDEKNLFKIALLCSLTGILIILLISENLETPFLKISEINKDLLEKQIKTSGKIINLVQHQTFTLFDIQDDTGKIKVITFEELDLEKDQEVEVEGIIKEYKNLLEIEAKQIKDI